MTVHDTMPPDQAGTNCVTLGEDVQSLRERVALASFIGVPFVAFLVAIPVTWSINSICHVVGERPFRSRDRSGNVSWLAIPSGGESWHNLHHADPTSARHGVRRWQLDTSARIIWILEKLGWAREVRWPTPERTASRTAPTL